MVGRRARWTVAIVLVAVTATFMVGVAPAFARDRGGWGPFGTVRNLFTKKNEVREQWRVRSLESSATTPAVKRAHRVRFGALGTVESVDVGGSTIVVRVKRASGAAKPYRGQSLTVVVNGATRFVGAKGLEGVYAGGRVAVDGFVVDGAFVARHLKFSPVKFVLNGVVTGLGDGFFSVRVKTGTKTVKGLVGTNTIVYYDERTKFVSAESTVPVTSLTVGAQVNVAGFFKGTDLWARRVVIKPLLHEGSETTETTTGGGTTTGTTAPDSTETTESSGDTTPAPTPGEALLREVRLELSWIQQLIDALLARIGAFFGA